MYLAMGLRPRAREARAWSSAIICGHSSLRAVQSSVNVPKFAILTAKLEFVMVRI